MDTRFHCVYLLTSLDPHCAGEYYIGYTVNPIRRIRQHNGELVNGAWRTKRRGRPWQLLCCVSGFGEDRIALKFEWCWQYPRKSTRLTTQMVHLRGVHRLPYAVAVLHFLLHTDIFARLQLTLHIFEAKCFQEVVADMMRRVPAVRPLKETSLLRIEEITKEQFQTQYLDEEDGVAAEGCVYFVTAPVNASQPGVNAAAPSARSYRYLCEDDILRQHARVKELLESGHCPCSLCTLPLKAPYFLRCSRTPFCAMRAHLACLAMWFTHDAMVQRKQQNQALLIEAGKATDCVGGFAVGAGISGPSLPSVPVNRGDDRVLGNHNTIITTSTHNPHVAGPLASASQGSRCSSSPGRAASATDVKLVPCRPCPCPLCDEVLHWGALVHDLKRRATLEKRQLVRQRREKMETIMAERLHRIQASRPMDRETRKKSTRFGKKRQRNVVESEEPRCSLNHLLDESANATSVSLPASLWAGKGTGSGSFSGLHPTGGGPHVEERVEHTSITDLCDSVLQVTEFNAEDWLDI